MSVSLGDDVYFLQDYVATLANGRTYKRYAAGSTYTADEKNIDFLDAGVTAGKGYVTGGADDAQVFTAIASADGPKSYAGFGGYLFGVKATEDGWEFVPPGGGSGSVQFLIDLGDGPGGYSSGDGGKLLAVKLTEDGFEFVDPADAVGTRYVQMVITDPAGSALTTGDSQGAPFVVPAAFNGWKLQSVAGHVTTVSSSGLPTVQIRNASGPTDMLTTKLTIDATEKDSSTATPAVIDTASSHDVLATGDEIWVDVDVAGTGAKGLIVTLGIGAP